MPKRENETDAEYKARKKAKKEKKRAAKRQKLEQKEDVVKSAEHEGDDTGTTVTSTSKNKKSTKAKKEEGTTLPEFGSFSDAPFVKPVQQALQDAGFTSPSPIQARAWPVVLAGKDLIAVAKTGSGKTLGFLLPIFHKISQTKALLQVVPKKTPSKQQQQQQKSHHLPSPTCLVLSPTRELAIQIHGECVKFGLSTLQIRSECVYGGTHVGQQIKQLVASDPRVVIATPGRLCDLLTREKLSLEHCSFCVLDEADRMMDMGFEKEINQVMNLLPKERQTLLFTATWPKVVRRVAAKFLRDGETEEIFMEGGNSDDGYELAANKAITQTFLEAQDDEKDKKLYDLLCNLDEKASIVIFANTKRRCDIVARTFWQEGFSTCSVHGDKPQHERDASLKRFIQKQCSILVATDVAARGLDIKGVTHVINFDMARDVESYVHRIGRTGRAGEMGESITFWNPDYDKPCSPALVAIAKNAGQEVPGFLKQFEKIKTSKQWKVADAEKATAALLTAAA